jgi:lysophospholipase L1-like esterase
MKTRSLSVSLVPLVIFIAACDDAQNSNVGSGGHSTGGTPQTAGSSAAGAGAGAGGTTAAGGNASAGTAGKANTGGSNAGAGTSGSTSAGGAPSAGAAGSTSSGGAPSAGAAGSTAMGGMAGMPMSCTARSTCVDGNTCSAGAGGSDTGTSGTHWVGTWATALQATEPRNLPTPASDCDPTPDNPGFAGNTLRQFIHVSIGGSQLRLRLSNEYGVAPVTLAAVHIANSKGGGAIDTTSDKALTFSGMPSVTIAPGQIANSDTFDFTLAALADLGISIKFGDQSKDVTGHPGSRTYSYLQMGDALSQESPSSDAMKMAHWYFISGLDVVADESTAAVAIIGDSLTDGRGSTNDGNDRWPDAFSRRLQMDPTTAKVGVLNAGIGGNAVLSGGIGPTAKTRFGHDVLDAPGVKWLIVFEGVNDIGGATTDVSGDLTSQFQQFVMSARMGNIKAYGATITPFGTNKSYDVMDHLAQRTTVNTWIKAADNFDAALDFDAAVRDPANPDKLRDDYADLSNSVGTDYLHMNPMGYQALADSIDLSLFK